MQTTNRCEHQVKLSAASGLVKERMQESDIKSVCGRYPTVTKHDYNRILYFVNSYRYFLQFSLFLLKIDDFLPKKIRSQFSVTVLKNHKTGRQEATRFVLYI